METLMNITLPSLSDWLIAVFLFAAVALLIVLLIRQGRAALDARRARDMQETTAKMAREMQRRQDEQRGFDIARMEERQERLSSLVEQRMLLLSQQQANQGAALEEKMGALAQGNEHQLGRIRSTVDEQLHTVLDERLSKNFAQVAQRLEAVQRALGEMNELSAGVGDLKKILAGVKTRGIWGEVQLEALLSEMLAPAQWEKNAQVQKGSAERVDAVVRMPGGGEDVLLPIDAKFPQEDYRRLLAAYDAGDAQGIAASTKALGEAILLQAKSIADKYIRPPHTTDFAVMFLPVEGLYAQVVRQGDLMERLQREARVTIAGPSTLAALLSSLQMGFRTLAIEQRSAEVWQLLGAIKGDFAQFDAALAKAQRALGSAGHSIEDAARKTRTIQRRLRAVETLPDGREDAPPVDDAEKEDDGEGSTWTIDSLDPMN